MGNVSEEPKPATIKYDDPNDPLFLHHTDQPGAILVSQLLTEENYSTWSRAMTTALSVKNKVGFIEGSIPKPTKASDTNIQQWTRCNDLVKSWLLNSMSQDIAASVIYYSVTNEICIDLKERFSHKNSVRLFHIEQEIHDCLQNNMTIGIYYTKLKGLWDERVALCAIPACTCRTMKEILQYQQTQKTMKFLMGLNESYTAVRAHILLMDPFPTVNKVHSLILQHEKQRAVSIGKGTIIDTAALVVRDATKGLYKGACMKIKNPHLKCEKCNKIEHTMEICRSHLKCEYCGWAGHLIDTFRKLKRANQMAGQSGFTDLSHKGNFGSANHVDSNNGTKAQANPITLSRLSNIRT